MRKLIALAVLVLMLSIVVNVSADELEDYKKEQAELQGRLVQYQQILQNIQVRLIEINAVRQYIESKKEKKLEVVE